jgi:hypothetical protein
MAKVKVMVPLTLGFVKGTRGYVENKNKGRVF